MLILTAFVNWIIIYMLLALYINSNILAAFISAVIIGGLTVLSTTEHAEKLYRYMNGMRRATKREVEQIKPILDDLCQRAGIQDLVLCVADEPFPNAYALGSKTVCVTKGLLKTANEEELAGILAHELGHLKYGDIDTPTAKAASPTPYGVTDGILE
ncbi:M48 family metalloprotease [Bacillus thuringiensis]